MTHLGVGIVGLGYMGLHHLKIIRRLAEDSLVAADVVHVCDPDVERLHRESAKYGIEGRSRAWQDLVNDPNIDAVFVASPWAYHKVQAVGTLEAGKALYCEKPVARDLSEVQGVVAAASSETAPTSQVGLTLRHSPTVEKLRRLALSGEFGPCRTVFYRHEAPLPDIGRYRTPIESRLAGRGILWEENIHDFDLLTWVFGDLRVEAATLDIDPAHPDIEVASNAVLQGGRDTTIHFQSAWHRASGWGSNRQVKLLFDQAVVVAEFFASGPIVVLQKDPQGRVDRSVHGEQELREALVLDRGYDPLLSNSRRYPWYSTFATLAFLQSVAAKQPAIPTISEALPAHELVEDIYKTASRRARPEFLRSVT